jgi:TonB family protein
MTWLFLLPLLASLACAQDLDEARRLTRQAQEAVFVRFNLAQGEGLAKKAVTAWEQSTNAKDPDYARALVVRGMLIQHKHPKGDKLHDEIEPLYAKALAIYDETSDPVNPLDRALALELQALVYNLTGRAGDAKPLSEKARALRVRHLEEMQNLKPATNVPPGPAGPHKIGGGVTAPTLSYKVEPEYSNEARVVHLQGTVVLFVIVGSDGNPRDLRLLRPLGLGLDERAFEAVQRWQFRPGAKDGQPVPVQATIEVNFRLK